jgi:formylglycine-generating enzyme required for sulfatase activity
MVDVQDEGEPPAAPGEPGDAPETRLDVKVSAGEVREGGRLTGLHVERLEGTLIVQQGDAAPDAAARLRAELRQAQLTRLPFEPETVLVPGGPFRMGTDDPAAPESERPAHLVSLPDFRIGRRPVTVGQYAAFLRAVSAVPAPEGWFNRQPPGAGEALEDPVTAVGWQEAMAYGAWLAERTGRPYTLPTEAEWEKAAAGAVPGGASALGVAELLGVVQQWTRTVWGEGPERPAATYPVLLGDGRDLGPGDKPPPRGWLVHRGGSRRDPPGELRATRRGQAPPDSRVAWRGFRVALPIGAEP